jgi:hypothetical protein
VVVLSIIESNPANFPYYVPASIDDSMVAKINLEKMAVGAKPNDSGR